VLSGGERSQIRVLSKQDLYGNALHMNSLNSSPSALSILDIGSHPGFDYKRFIYFTPNIRKKLQLFPKNAHNWSKRERKSRLRLFDTNY